MVLKLEWWARALAARKTVLESANAQFAWHTGVFMTLICI